MSGCRKSFRILPVPREKYLLKSASYFATSRMSSKKTSILLCLLVALSFAVVSVFIQTGGQAAVAQSGPLPQSSEAFGLAGGCYVGGQFIPYEGTCGDQTQPTECAYSQEICKPVGGTGECKPARHDTLFGTVCKQGLGCKAASTCDGKGTCIEGKVVDCSLQDTECEKWGCANAPGGTCEVIQRIDKVDAVCLKTTDPIVCGQRYWERYSVTSPAKCGGKKECPANTQLDGPACPECSCGYALPPNLDWCGGRRGWCTNGTDLCKSYCDTIGAGTSSYSNDSGACTCSGVPNLQVCPTSLSVSWSAEKYQWVESLTTPASCRPSTPPSKIATSCSWASLGTQTIGFTLTQSHFSATVSGGIPGTFSYNHSAGEMLPLGDTLMTATFTPNDQTLYSGTTCSSTVTIVPKKTTCAVSASNGTAGTKALGLVSAVAYDAQFAFITVKGTFTYTIDGQTPSASLVLDAGKTYPVVAKFQPSEWGYEGTSCQGSITIDAQSAICTVDSASRPYNTTLSKALGFVCKVGSVAITTVISGGVVAAPPAQGALPGDYPVGFSSAPTSTNYSIKTMPGTVTVTPVDSSCRLTGLTGQSVEFGTAISFGAQGYIGTSGTILNGGFAFSDGGTTVSDGSALSVGTHTIAATFTPSNAGYQASTCSGSVTVTASTCSCGYVAPVNDSNGAAFCQSVCGAIKAAFNGYTQAGYCSCGGVPATVCPATANGAAWTTKSTVPPSCAPSGTVSVTCSGSVHSRPYGTANPSLSYSCTDANGVDVKSKLSAGTFAAGPATTEAAGPTYDVAFAAPPAGSGYTVKIVPAKITVTKVASSCSISPDAISANQAVSYAKFNPSMTPSGVMSYYFSSDGTKVTEGGTLAGGSYGIRADLAPTDSVNYDPSSCTGTLVVNKTVSCTTIPLILATSKTYDETFVKTGFTVLADVVLGGSWSFTVGGAPISYASRPASQITVSGTFQPSNSGYSSVTCSTTVKPVQCTPSTVAADCTADDGNACTVNACNGTRQCYNKYKGASGSLSPVVTLTCPNTFRVDFNDVLACVDPTDSSALYRIGVDYSSTLGWPTYPGSLISMNDTTVPRSACSAGKCSYSTTAIGSTYFLSGMSLYGGVAAFSAGYKYAEQVVSKAGTCSAPGINVTCTGSVHSRPYGTANPSLSYSCTDANGVDVKSKLSAGTFAAGPATTEAAGPTYDVAFAAPPAGSGYTVKIVPAKITVTKVASSCSISPDAISANQAVSYAKFNPSMTPSGVMSYYFSSDGTKVTEGGTLAGGSYGIRADLAPTDSVNYDPSSCTGTLVVNKTVSCTTIPLILATSKTYDETFVKTGFTVLADVVLGGSWSFTVGGAPISYASRPASQITVSGTFQPSNSGYSSVTCSTTVKPVQCTPSTVAADCTADDGNACTVNACNGTGQCYNKTITTPIGSISPTMELICPANGASTGQIKLTWTDNATCTDSSYSYSILASTTAPPAFSPTPGPSDALSTTATRSACSGTSCSVTKASAATNFRSGKTIYASVAILSNGMYYQHGSTSKPASCAWCGDGKINGTDTCDGTAFPTGQTPTEGYRCNACNLEWCGDGKINGTETCDGTTLPAGSPTGSTCTACVLDTPPSTICKDLYSTKSGYQYYSATSDPGADPNVACAQAESKLSVILGGFNMTGLTLVQEPSDKVYSVGSSGKINIVSMKCVASACVYSGSGSGGGGTGQCPAVSPSCGSSCTRAPYPDCSWTCSGTCETTPITYYTADGECQIATAWGPSASCCPNQGCDIKPHGYGDQHDQYEWFKMVPLSSACPSKPGTIVGDDIRCPTCHCGNDTDCQLKAADGTLIDFKFVPSLPKYGHLEGETVEDDRCFCHPNQKACPSGYVPLQQPFTVHYTDIATKGLLAGTTCQ